MRQNQLASLCIRHPHTQPQQNQLASLCTPPLPLPTETQPPTPTPHSAPYLKAGVPPFNSSDWMSIFLVEPHTQRMSKANSGPQACSSIRSWLVGWQGLGAVQPCVHGCLWQRVVRSCRQRRATRSCLGGAGTV